MSFDNAMEILLRHEGNYANVPGDRGGETYQGISRNIWSTWTGWRFIDEYKLHVGRSLKRNELIPSLELSNAVKDFYRQHFWDKVYGDQIKNEHLAILIFDIFVNSGAMGIKIVQQAANNLGSKLKIDGVIGPVTLATINSLPAARLHDTIKQIRKTFLIKLSEKPNQSQFLKGWMARVNSFPDLQKKSS